MTGRGEAVDVEDRAHNDPADGVFAAERVLDEIQANSWYHTHTLIKP